MVKVHYLTGTDLVEACPLCGHEYGSDGGSRWRVVLEPRLDGVVVEPTGAPVGIGFSECTNCSFIHQRSLIPEEAMIKIYSGPMYNKIVRNREDVSMRSAVYNEAWRAYELCKLEGGGLIPSYVDDADRILDIGCGKLILIQSMDYFYGPEVTDGVDPNVTSKRIGKTLGFQVWDQLDDVPEGSQYDLITHIHTLEHIYDPKEHLHKVRELLTPDGTLILMVPNMYSASALNFFHLVGYTTTTLRWMVESCGFDVIDIRPVPACWMRWFPQDIICVARRGEYKVPNYKRDRLLSWKKNMWNKLFLRWSALHPIIWEPRVPKLIVPVYISSMDELRIEFGEEPEDTS